MKNYMYEKLKGHIGHSIVCVAYGDVENPQDICIECEDCGEVLVSAEDFGQEETEVKIKSISMKEVIGGETYFRMWVPASELPEWMYLKAKEIDEEFGYLKERDKQCFEIGGLISSIDNKAYELKLVYYFDEYKTITELDENYHEDIYKEFERFASKYGALLPDNGELRLGDCEYEEQISYLFSQKKQ